MEQFLIDDQVFLYGLENLTDEVEQLLYSDRKSQERVSSWVARVISDLSLLGEIRRQLGSLRPGPPMTEAVSIEDKQEEFSSRMKLTARIYEIFTKDMKIASAGLPQSKF